MPHYSQESLAAFYAENRFEASNRRGLSLLRQFGKYLQHFSHLSIGLSHEHHVQKNLARSQDAARFSSISILLGRRISYPVRTNSLPNGKIIFPTFLLTYEKAEWNSILTSFRFDELYIGNYDSAVTTEVASAGTMYDPHGLYGGTWIRRPS